MRLRYRFRLYPTPGQHEALTRTFGCARVVFNDGLVARQEAFEAGRPYLSNAELSKRLTAAKTTPERAWLGEVSAAVLQQALADLNAAYRNYFDSLTGKRKGPKVGPPRLRSRKDHRQAIRFTGNARFAITAGGKLRLPKIGAVPVRWSRPLPSDPSSVTVIKDSSGRYFASFVIEAAAEPLVPAGGTLGIDLGLSHFAVLSDGRKVTSPQFLRRAENWSAFVAMLEYKARLYGRQFHRIGRFEPTSQVCSACGVRDGPMPLHVREWACSGCGAIHDRDVNAARNIAMAAGLAVTACGTLVRPRSALAQRGEAGTHRSAA
ncbi:MAG: RNA-guided endonuclease InsQ/TnpB family protein [Gemmatimonadota bacterium]